MGFSGLRPKVRMVVTRVKIEMRTDDVRQLLVGPEVTADISSRAQRIATAAGPGFVVEMPAPEKRAIAMIYAADRAARKAEATDRVLSRAIDAGR